MSHPTILGEPTRGGLKARLSAGVRVCCSVRNLKRKLPVVGWLQRYDLGCFVGDMIAGITVGLTAIPQGIAYGDVAGLPVQYGLYTAFLGCFIYAVFGSVRQFTIGPTVIMALLVNSYAEKGGPPYVALICFLTGLLQLTFGVLNLGILADLISLPVSSGFVTAAFVIIATSQLKNLLGVNIAGGNVFELWWNLARSVADINIWDAVMGLTAMVIIVILKQGERFGKRKLTHGAYSCYNLLYKMMWFIAISRNVIVVLASSGVTMLTEEQHLFSVTGSVEAGLPQFQVPQFHISASNRTMDFVHIIKDSGMSIVVMTLVSVLSVISIGKAFCKHESLDTSQEILTLGLINTASSFVGAFPASTSFGRSALNNASGVRTPISGVWTGTLVILTLLFFTPYCHVIPKPALGAIIITAVYSLHEFATLTQIVRARRLDSIAWITTFLSCLLLGVNLGILLGVTASILVLLWDSSKIKIRVETVHIDSCPSYLFRFDRNIYFPSVEYTVGLLSGYLKDHTELSVVIFDWCHVTQMDFSTAKVMLNYARCLQEEKRTVRFRNLSPEVKRTFKLTGHTTENALWEPDSLEASYKQLAEV